MADLIIAHLMDGYEQMEAKLGGGGPLAEMAQDLSRLINDPALDAAPGIDGVRTRQAHLLEMARQYDATREIARRLAPPPPRDELEVAMEVLGLGPDERPVGHVARQRVLRHARRIMAKTKGV